MSNLPSSFNLESKPDLPRYVSRLPHLLLVLLITVYALYFSLYTLNRHQTLHSYTADLSLIDQPMWNTVIGPGGFMELTWGDHQQPRLAEHFEPILVPLALLFYLWNDVRILLIAQSIALALGAIPVFWIAKKQLTNDHWRLSLLPAWIALAFAAVYLLFPALQAANIADFHADPFVVTPLLFAFWYATQKRWLWLWFWAIIALATKETLPPLVTMLGVWLIMSAGGRPQTANSTVSSRRPAVIHGFGLILVGVLWFLIATFLIVSPLAQQYFGTNGPIYFASRYTGDNMWQSLQDPARWHYLLGLFAAVGYLPLLAPELLILGLPVLLANFFSSYPGQYSGEQHYSAPLVVAFVLAAIYGMRRLIDKLSLSKSDDWNVRTAVPLGALLWLLAWSLSYHTLHGWTPLSIRTETYRLTAAAARLPDFTQLIPSDAVVSASAAINPHLAHRRVIYTFPTIQEANYLLVDVTDIPGVHPNDAHAQILNLLNHGWQLLQADQGLILAQKISAPASSLPPCPAAPPFPCPFYDFARTTASPTNPLQLTFGDGRLRLMGYDFHDDIDNGITFRFYWQTSGPLPQDLRLWPLIYDDRGRLLNDPPQMPLIATVWYPPSAWQPGETIVTETLPQLLPPTFHLGLAVGPENSFADPTQRYQVIAANGTAQLYPGRWAQLATFRRQGPFLTRLAPILTLQSLTPTTAAFGPAIQLTGYWFDQITHPGASLPVLLKWTATPPPSTDYTVFIHLLAADGRRVAQSDIFPTWLTPQPTSQWPSDTPLLDSHLLALPADLSPGTYTLQLGLYNPQNQERLTLPDGHDTFPLGQIEVK